ncbi:MAG: 23S rRNA (adenine(1618)-N(6))-methyltransferase RlmF, partial [Chitinophagaceae bacterium]|nr:23S rRNA (adenine(1618)-N(6))-methyltransferase RlmF [Chitinophagaceae bacterium]
MQHQKKEHPKEKTQLHPRNKHRERYNFSLLIKACPALAAHVSINKYEEESINFFDPQAVRMLNTALLKYFYSIGYWEIPANYLCPPIPARADYIHYAADLLSSNNETKIPTGNKINCLDIGVGANCIYPIIGHMEYGWHFVGSDIDTVSIASANQIIGGNPLLKDKIEARLQPNASNIFKGIIQKDEYFDLTICNPPFHASAEEAKMGSIKKLNNLQRKKSSKPILNFGGSSNELWYNGGEEKFIGKMIDESRAFAKNVFWFT